MQPAQTGVTEESRVKEQTLQVPGGPSLALRVYEAAGNARASVVIAGAMGVRQAFYEPFARWLAQQGFRVTTFDYRGHGDSLQGPLRAVQADLFDWAQDYEAVISEARQALAQRPLYLLGHSLGAQLPGLLQRPQQVDGLLSVAAGSGYWRENAPSLRRKVPWFWWVLVPLATPLCGYFPGRRLRVVGDLPAGVIWQWRRWCLNPRYSVGAEGEGVARSYAAVRFPLIAMSMSDDEMMTLRGTRSLLQLYANAPHRIDSIRPADVQARRIGHFGFFRTQFQDTLWPRAVAALGQLGAERDATAAATAQDGSHGGAALDAASMGAQAVQPQVPGERQACGV